MGLCNAKASILYCFKLFFNCFGNYEKTHFAIKGAHACVRVSEIRFGTIHILK